MNPARQKLCFYYDVTRRYAELRESKLQSYPTVSTGKSVSHDVSIYILYMNKLQPTSTSSFSLPGGQALTSKGVRLRLPRGLGSSLQGGRAVASKEAKP